MNIATIGVCAVGVVAYLDLPREVFPYVAYDLILVTTAYPGVGPREIESLITIPVENGVAAVDGIDHIRSTSVEGLSAVEIELERDADPGRVSLDVEAAINRIPDLPPDADDPVVKVFEPELPVLSVAIRSTAEASELRMLARDLGDELTTVAGVSKVSIAGLPDREFVVEVDPDALQTYAMSSAEIMSALARHNVNVPGGRIEADRTEYFVRTMGKFRDVAGIERVVIRSDGMGGLVRVADVAAVREDSERSRSLARVGGERAVVLDVLKRPAGDYIKVSDAVHERIAQWTALPEGTSLEIIGDASKWVRTRMSTMHGNGLLGFVLVLLLLFVVLDAKIAFVTALGIPVALLGTFIIMGALDLTSNMITMFGLVLVIGILVDDAIVVTENVYRHRAMGKTPRQAAIDGADEVTRPVIGAVATTIAVFFPITLLPGLMGKVTGFIPKVVIIALMVSLAEALLILPSHLAEWGHSWRWWRKGDVGHSHREARWFLAVQDGFARLLTPVTRHRKKALFLILAGVAGLMFLALSTTRFVPFPASAVRNLYIDVEMAPGTRLEETERVVALVETALLELPENELDSVVSVIGLEPRANLSMNAPDFGRVTVTLTDRSLRSRDGHEIASDARARLAGIVGAERIDLRLQSEAPLGRSIDVRVRGDDFHIAIGLAEAMAAEALAKRGVESVALDTTEGKDEVRISMKASEAAMAGVDLAGIAVAVHNAFEGGVATKVELGDEEIDVVVRWPEGHRRDLNDLSALLIPTRAGASIPFTHVASSDTALGYGALHRYDRKAMVGVLGDIDDEVGSVFEINRELEERAAELMAGNPGYQIDLGGEDEQTREFLAAVGQLTALGVLLVYAIMAGLFRSWGQPLIILCTSVPFGLFGVVIGLWASGAPISNIAMLGTVALIGIVVNDSIVLVDFINKALARGMPVADAVIEAGRTRLRPVVLTSITTVVGLLPMALGIFGSEEFLVPMARAIVWGLGFATVLTLFVVPTTYRVLDDVRRAFGGRSGSPDS